MSIAQLLFPDFSLILIGFLLCRHTALKQPVWQSAEGLVYYFLFPVLLFQSIVRTPLDVRAASGLMLAGLITGTIGIALSYTLPHLPGIGRWIDRRDHAASAQVAFRFNSFIGLAIAERLLGAQGLQLIAVLIGVCVPLFNVGAVWPMARHAQRSFLGELVRNPLILATASGLAFNLLGLKIPEWLVPTVTRIGAASLALGLMTTGAALQFSALKDGKALAVGVLTIRHALAPLVAWLVSHLMRLGAAESTILMAFSALPTASSCYVLAARMGYNGAYVAALVTLSTLLGMASLAAVLAFIQR